MLQADEWDLDAIHQALMGPSRKLQQATGDVAAVRCLPPCHGLSVPAHQPTCRLSRGRLDALPSGLLFLCSRPCTHFHRRKGHIDCLLPTSMP